MQGRLRNEQLAVKIESECAHCGLSLHLTVNSELAWSVQEYDASPLVFEPDIDWKHLSAPNIIADY
ncbi:MAG TPA: hypothetical protein VFQ36_20345 [Ktedonobacteraceae bacterium]|nr:hypothetical protein [Ktedonobacteraceae bacterium]